MTGIAFISISAELFPQALERSGAVTLQKTYQPEAKVEGQGSIFLLRGHTNSETPVLQV